MKRAHADDDDDAQSGDDARSGAESEPEPAPKPKKAKKAKAAPPKKKAPADGAAAAADKTPATPVQKKGKGKPSVAAVAPASEDVAAPPATTPEDSDDEMADAAHAVIRVAGFAPSSAEASPATTTTTPAATETAESTPAATPAPAKAPKAEIDPVARAEQRARLAARIETLRATRKADNTDGSSARTRQELMEARRKKEAERKERKKAVRLASRMSTEEGGEVIESIPGAPEAAAAKPNPVTVVKNFSFGRVMFDDGNQLDASLTAFKKEKRREGPRDILGQLKHTEAKKRRIENMTDEKKEVVMEKEKWSKALKQATGEKVKDDEKLLKKALKRQEATKRKSSSEW